MAYETKPAIYFAGKPGDLVRVYHLDAETSSLGILVGPTIAPLLTWANQDSQTAGLRVQVIHSHQIAGFAGKIDCRLRLVRHQSVILKS
jgi:hypothetical protein